MTIYAINSTHTFEHSIAKPTGFLCACLPKSVSPRNIQLDRRRLRRHIMYNCNATRTKVNRLRKTQTHTRSFLYLHATVCGLRIKYDHKSSTRKHTQTCIVCSAKFSRQSRSVRSHSVIKSTLDVSRVRRCRTRACTNLTLQLQCAIAIVCATPQYVCQVEWVMMCLCAHRFLYNEQFLSAFTIIRTLAIGCISICWCNDNSGDTLLLIGFVCFGVWSAD